MTHRHRQLRFNQCNCFKCGRTRADIENRPGIPCRVQPGRKAAKVRRWARSRLSVFAAQIAVSA